jgi:predicted dehydrogenase
MLGLEADFVALADAFEDKAFEQADKYGVDRSRCIVGWDAYQKVAESDADFVMLITPPVFRPQHLEMLVEAGKHVLMQKPVAVDAPGCRKVIEAGERAKKKGLAILAGTQRRHTVGYMENAAKIENGAIGEILGGTVSWNGTVPWIWERQKSCKDDIHLHVKEGILTLEAERTRSDEEKAKGRVIRQEQRYGKIMRSFNLGVEVEEANIKASFVNGVLSLQAPKVVAKEQESRRIEIS